MHYSVIVVPLSHIAYAADDVIMHICCVVYMIVFTLKMATAPCLSWSTQEGSSCREMRRVSQRQIQRFLVFRKKLHSYLFLKHFSYDGTIEDIPFLQQRIALTFGRSEAEILLFVTEVIIDEIEKRQILNLQRYSHSPGRVQGTCLSQSA